MKNRSIQLAIMLLYIALISCNDEGGAIELDPVNEELKMVNANVVLDGIELLTIPITDFTSSIIETEFSYTTSEGSKSGTWEINDSKNLLIVEFDEQMFEFPLISSEATEFVFIAQQVNLNNSLNEKESNTLLMVNQLLQENGSSWQEKSSSAQLLEINFTIRIQ